MKVERMERKEEWCLKERVRIKGMESKEDNGWKDGKKGRVMLKRKGRVKRMESKEDKCWKDGKKGRVMLKRKDKS